MQPTFRPGVFTRFMEEATKTVSKKIESYKLPKEVVMQEAGGSLKKLDPSQAFNCRALLRLNILFVSMYLAAYTITSPIVKSILTIFNIDIDKLQEENEFKKQYLAIVFVFVIFIALTIAYNELLFQLVYYTIYMYYDSGDAMNARMLAAMKYDNWFELFGSKIGPGKMDVFKIMVKFALIGLATYMVIYMLFVKSFLRRFDYAEYNPEGTEHPNERKFLLIYILTVVYAILVMLGLFTMFISTNNLGVIFYNAVLFFVYAMIATAIIHQTLQRHLFRSLFLFLILIAMAIANFVYITE